MKIKMLLERKSFYMLLGFITLLVLFLGSSRQIQAFTGAGHDDRLFVNHAISLVQGNWLGSYNQFTLIKGPFYPFFLAINHVLGLPLLLSQQVFYCLSGLALIYALSYFCRDRLVLLLLYTFYLFHPLPFVTNRVVREGVYASLTTFVIAGAVLAAADLMGKVKPSKVVAGHACLFGLSLSCFWLTREEGIWLIPTIVFLVALGFVNQYYQRQSLKILVRRSRTLILSLMILIVCVMGVSFINYTHYGVFLARSELLSTEFKAAYGALTRVKSETSNSHVPVTLKVRQQLYAKSEKFRALQSYLEAPAIVNGWSQPSCHFYPSTCGDYAGGWFVWVLRDAVANAGYVDKAPNALKFYRDLAIEVNGLCDSKQLDCLPSRTGTLPPIKHTTLKELPETFQKGLNLAFGLPKLNLQAPPTSIGDQEGFTLFTDWTRTPTAPTQPSSCQFNHLEAVGWVNRVGTRLKLADLIGEERPAGEFISRTNLPSPDLVKAFNNPFLSENRFTLNICCKICKLALTDEKDKLLTEVNLMQGQTQGGGPWGLYHFESIKPFIPKPITVISSKINISKLAFLDLLNRIFYQKILYYASIFAIGLWCLRLLLSLFRVLPWTIGYGLATSILLAILVRVALLALIDLTSFPALNFYYLLPAVVLVPVFTILLFADTFVVCRKRRSLNF